MTVKTDTHYYFLKGWESNFNHPTNGVTFSREDLLVLLTHLETIYHEIEDYVVQPFSFKFKTTEAAFMWIKAMFFNDLGIAARIAKAETPQEAKDLGRQIKNFNAEEWSKVSYTAMYEVNLRKYQQNPDLAEKLLATDELHLVEANGKINTDGKLADPIWSCGFYEDDPKILDQSNWTGKNLLGKVLMEVRDSFKIEKA